MTANLYIQSNHYHVMLSWQQNGKRKQKSIKTGISAQGNNKRKAETVRKNLLEEWEKKVSENFQDILFSDYLKEWLETVRHSIAETTFSNYTKTIHRLICPYFTERKIKLHDLRPYHIQAFYKWKMETDGVTGSTIRRYHANIHKALKYAYQTELIRDNPAAKVMLPKQERFIADFYTAEELRKLLDAVKGEKIETPVLLAAWFGLRRGEALGLRWQDIDFEAMTLSVQGVVTDKGLDSRSQNLKYRDGAKTPASLRSFPLPQEVADYLSRQKAQQEENKRLGGDCYCTQWEGFVCVDAIGELTRPEYLSRTFPLFLEKHGLRPIRFHELRDSNASLLLDKGVDMKRIQSWMGHAHFSTTADIYAHLRKDAKQGLGELLSQELGA